MTTKTANPGPPIKARKPTGQVAFPLLLLEGPEKAGKSLIPVVLSRSERVGMTYWIDLGEGAADEYAALPGSRYMVIEHDGSYRDILEQVTAVWNEAKRAKDADEPPVVITVDSGSALWTMLVNWTNERARRSNVGKRKLADDPDAEIDPTSNLWNDATDRWYRVVNLLMTFPGIAIVTARGKEVKIGANGQPMDRPEWKVEGQKSLAYDVSAWIRVLREPRTSQLVGARSLRVSVPKGRPSPMPTIPVEVDGEKWDVCDLDAFVFDVLGCTPTATRDFVQLRGDDLGPILADVEVAPTEDDLKAVWDRVKAGLTPVDHKLVSDAVTARLAELRAPDPEKSDDPTLDDHGPDSDAEKLRGAAEARAQAEADRVAAQEVADSEATASVPDGDGVPEGVMR